MKITVTKPNHSEKTDELFRSRLVIPLAQSLLGEDEYSHWLSSARAIQEAIYQIDSYYESNRTLLSLNEQPMWKLVQTRIKESNASSSFFVWKSFSDLRLYGHVEARIHVFDIIDPREFSEIARLKTADVRIARALIWSYLDTPSQSVLRFWRMFDECGELIEDLADIAEDGRDWNFNFWLYSYMAEGEAVKSLSGAAQALKQSLAALEEAYMRLGSVERDRLREVFQASLRAGVTTLKNCGIVFDLLAHQMVIRYGEEVTRSRVA